ncbi:hypothetical protein CROQUDRAFT_654595 [Cronartium quercuum f. sp. fusiforme G11]|uniref:Uncharacterized protein n=1 Tax=Cronartium quercuum f. sp. fusiforme G11 TaxID=708437 RepID=A0A9P6NSJ8_9BASI|nr:hypothetical protein CROQUDRAFT_654595 [Cronartium quercuum f. sp. fusiforme G11]
MSTTVLPTLDSQQDASKFIAQCGFMYRDESQISKSLLCPICSEPWIEPLVASFCGHLFCSKCIHTWIKHIPTCPVDRSPLTPSRLTQPPKILNQLVEELFVVCSLGCGWEGRRDEWKDHLERYCAEAGTSAQVEEKTKAENEDERWKKVVREVAGLKKEAKDYVATIEMWKDKVEKLQLELRKALEAAPVEAETEHRSSSSTSSSSDHSNLPAHRATCDFCRCHIHGTRYKCLKCPDLDSCQTCFGSIALHHPIHDFVPIRDPADVTVISLPEWKIDHPRVSCNHCGSSVVGPRFKCTLCADYDLCHLCFALPRPPHPLSHPMTRYVHPQR